MSAKIIGALALAIVSCGLGDYQTPVPLYDLRVPFSISVETPPADINGIRTYNPSEVLSDVSDAVYDMGGTTAMQGQQIHVRSVADADVVQRCAFGADTFTEGFYTGDTVWLCPASIVLSKGQRRQLVYHEVGHIFGGAHIPCTTPGVMVATMDCYSAPGRDQGAVNLYTAADVATICAIGRTIGRRCPIR